MELLSKTINSNTNDGKTKAVGDALRLYLRQAMVDEMEAIAQLHNAFVASWHQVSAWSNLHFLNEICIFDIF